MSLSGLGCLGSTSADSAHKKQLVFHSNEAEDLNCLVGETKDVLVNQDSGVAETAETVSHS